MNSRCFLLALAVLMWGTGASCRKEASVSFRVFRELACPVNADFSALRMADSLHGVAVGGIPWASGFIISTSDGGLTWQSDTVLNRKMESVSFDRGGQAYVCGQDLALYRPPGSPHWDDFRVNFQWNRACHFWDDRHGAMVGGGTFRFGQMSVFGPDAFWRLDTFFDTDNAMAAVWFSDSVTLHAVGMGWIMRSTDAGKTWDRLDITGDFFCSVHFPSVSTGYICGSSGTILKTSNGGMSWQTLRKGGSTGRRNQPFRALWFAGNEKGYLVGDDGLFWQTENGGADWQQVEEAPEGIYFTAIYARADRGWAVAKGGRMFYFEP
jgi:photosystem II stability/assembly factor-like uncharacterized protein